MSSSYNGIKNNVVYFIANSWMMWGKSVVPIVALSVLLHVLLRVIWLEERVTVFVIGIWPLYVVFQLYMLYRCGVSAIHSVLALAAIWCYYVSYHYLHINEGFKYLTQYELEDILSYGNQTALELASLLLIIYVLWALSDKIASIVMVLMLYISEPVFVIESLRIHMKSVKADVNVMYMSVVADGLIWFVICVIVIAYFVHRAMVKRSRAVGHLECSNIYARNTSNQSECIYGDKRSYGGALIYLIDVMVVLVFVIVNMVPGALRSQVAYRYNCNIMKAQNKIVDDVSRYICKHVAHDINQCNRNAEDNAYNKIKDKIVVFKSSNDKYLINTEHDIQCLRSGMYWMPQYRCVSVVTINSDILQLSSFIKGDVFYILAVYDMAKDMWRPLLVTNNERSIRGDSYMNISLDDFDVFE